MLKTDTIIPGLEVPNLDDLSDEDLDNAYLAFFRLAQITRAIYDARNSRLRGQTVEAIERESRVDHLYMTLPQSMRY